MIYTSCFSTARHFSSLFVPVSISFLAPLWWKLRDPEYHRYTELAPTESIVGKYSDAILDGKPVDESRYEDSYVNEVLAHLSPASVVADLERYKIDDRQTIVLCCKETPNKFCHRHLVAKWLRSYGYDAEEYNIWNLE